MSRLIRRLRIVAGAAYYGRLPPSAWPRTYRFALALERLWASNRMTKEM